MLVEGIFSGGNIFWVMSWFPICGSETPYLCVQFGQ